MSSMNQSSAQQPPANPSSGAVGYLPPLTFGAGMVDWQHRVDPTALREQRADRARTLLKECGIAAALVGGADYCRYLTGLKGPEFAPDLWYVLFPADSDPIVFAHAGYVENMPAETPWIHEWRVARAWLRGIPGEEASRYEAAAFARDVQIELEKLGLADELFSVVGFDRHATAALDATCAHVVFNEEWLQRAMSIKTPEELTCLRMAGAITDRMWSAMASGARVGMTDGELAAIGRAAGTSGGADAAVAGFRAGALAGVRGIKGTGQFIVPGDLMFGNVCGTSYLGYKACSYRTFSVGRAASASERSSMQRLEDRLLGVISELYPGNATSAAARHFPPADEFGHSDEVELLTVEIGHGIGLHQYEMPVVNRQWSLEFPQQIEEGMVVAVEGREGSPGQPSVRIEYMAAVTKDGPQLIDRYPTGIVEVG